MKVGGNSITVDELADVYEPHITVHLQDVQPDTITLFVDKLPASLKGKGMYFFLGAVARCSSNSPANGEKVPGVT